VNDVNAAAAFLRMASQDPELRDALATAISESKEAEQNVLSTAVELARERGLDLSTSDLRDQLEQELGLAEIVVEEELAAGSGCKSNSGCRTPCVYCKATDDGDDIEPVVVEPIE
jgi:hypothetical protein